MLGDRNVAIIFHESVWDKIERRGQFSRLVFLKKLDAKLEEGNRLFRALALMSVFPKWCAVVVVGLLHRSRLSGRSCMLGPRGMNSEDMQVLLTNVPQRHWKWQEDHRDACVVRLFTLGCARGSRSDLVPSGPSEVGSVPHTPEGRARG